MASARILCRYGGSGLLALSLVLWGCEVCERIASGLAVAGDTDGGASVPSAPPAASLDVHPNARTETNSDQVFRATGALPKYTGPKVSRLVGQCAVLANGGTQCLDGFRLPPRSDGEPLRLGSGGLVAANRSSYDTMKAAWSGSAVDPLGSVWCWGEVKSHSSETCSLPLGALDPPPGRRGEEVSSDRWDLLLRLRVGCRCSPHPAPDR